MDRVKDWLFGAYVPPDAPALPVAAPFVTTAAAVPVTTTPVISAEVSASLSFGIHAEAKAVLNNSRNSSDEDLTLENRNDYNIFCRRCKGSVNRYDAGKAVLALGYVYHARHFTCFLCGCSTLLSYYPHPSNAAEVICCDCHYKIANPPCAGCDLPLMERSCRTQNKLWHHDCIRCTACQQIINKEYCDMDGRFFHEVCLHMQLHSLCGDGVAPE